MSTSDLLSVSDPALVIGDEITVNTNRVTTKGTPSITQLAGGGHVVVWHSLNQDGDAGGIFGQLFAPDGTAVGSEFQINQNSTDDQFWPSVAATPDGGFVVKWQTRDLTVREWDVSAQRYDSSGARVGDQIIVAEITGGALVQSDLTVLDSGKFIVSWQDSSAQDIFARVFNPDGTPAGDAFIPHENTANSQFTARSATLPGDTVAMIWGSNAPGSGGVQLRLFEVADGAGATPLMPTVAISDIGASFEPDIFALTDGRFVVTWGERPTDGSGDGVFARILPADFAALASDPVTLQEALEANPIFQVNTTTLGNQNAPEVVGLPDGGFVISWSDLSSNSGDIFLQQYSVDGTPVGGERLVNTTTADVQRYSQLAATEDGFIVIWMSDDNSVFPRQTDVNLQRFALEPDTGTLVIDQSGAIVSNDVDRTDDPAVLITGSDNTLINESGTTLTGTGPNYLAPNFDAAVEITGTGNTVVNELGAAITGVIGVNSQAANTTVRNAGDIIGINTAAAGVFDDSSALRLVIAGATVENSGLMRSQAGDNAITVLVSDDATVSNQGTIEAEALFRAIGIQVHRDGTVSNDGDIDVVARSIGYGINANSSFNVLENDGNIRVSGEGRFGNFGMRANAFSTLVNTGTIEISASDQFGRAGGIWTIGIANSVDNQGSISVVADGPGDRARANGLDLTAGLASNSGTITAGSINGVATGVRYLNGGDFTNDGHITATGATGIGLSMRYNGSVTNNGVIEAVATAGPSIGLDFGTGSFSTNEIVNTGTITADIAIRDTIAVSPPSSGVQNLTNSGTINGLIDLNQSDDTITNSGAINGDVFLGDGDDVFDNALGTLTGSIFAELGNDAITNAGIITGDVFLGDGDDVFHGSLEGTLNGSVIGGLGNDTVTNAGIIDGEVRLGDGSDVFNGSLGGTLNGSIFAELGNDTITNAGIITGDVFLGDGDDVFNGSLGGILNGSIIGGLGNDTITNAGTINGDVFLGGGVNVFDGSLGTLNGAVVGDLGNDTISGGMGAQALFGGAGDDTLFGNAGDDFLIGGAGADMMDGGDGFDALDYSASQAAVQVNLGDARNIPEAPVKAGAGTAFGGDAEGDTFSNIEAVFGSAFDDFAFGGANGEQFLLGAGNDVARGGGGNDLVDGGDGDDILSGDAGDDTLIGGAGADVMDGGAGLDILDYSDSQAGVQVNLGDARKASNAPVRADEGTAFGGDAEGDTFSNIEAVIGSEFDDFVYGNADGNQVLFLGGDDVFDNRSSRSTADFLDMGDGNDVARTGNGNDVINGGDGNDELRGERGNDTLTGDAGDDLLVGDRGRDVLDGGAGNDRLFGGRSTDTLIGGGGDDDLYGGSSRDVFVFTVDGGNDTIFDFSTSRRSGDRIDVTAFDSLNTFADILAIATEVNNDTVLALDMTTSVTLVGIDLDRLDSGDFLFA